jgi:acetyl-CoA acetyltransferase
VGLQEGTAVLAGHGPTARLVMVCQVWGTCSLGCTLAAAVHHDACPPSRAAGMPETVPVRTVNRQCSSGLQAVADVAAAIK